MDAVISDNQRDAQTRLLIDGLGGTRLILGAGMQNGSDMLIHDEILKIAAAGVKLHHLADLLFKGHTREQVGDPLTSEQIRILVR